MMLKEEREPEYSRLRQTGREVSLYVGLGALYLLGRAGEAANKVPILSNLLFGPKMGDSYRR